MKYILIVVLLAGTSLLAQAQQPTSEVPAGATFSSTRFALHTQPLYLLSSGETITEAECKELADHNRVSSLRVMPATEAVEKYGDRAKAGVVVVTLKDTSFATEFLNRKRNTTTH